MQRTARKPSRGSAVLLVVFLILLQDGTVGGYSGSSGVLGI